MTCFDELVRRTAGPSAGEVRVVFAPHPDDEVLGLGGHLPRWPGTHVVYVTDGAPNDPEYFEPLGYRQRIEYASARRRESLQALRLAGIGAERVHELGAADQGVCRLLAPLARRVAGLLAELQPCAAFAPAYEGGHPDHDGTALAVHASLELLRAGQHGTPALFEYATYHERDGTLIFGELLPDETTETLELYLDPAARDLKKRMISCHETQLAFLRQASAALERECVRRAPRYDFRLPPRAPFHYDRLDWGTSGREFLKHARDALEELGIEGPC